MILPTPEELSLLAGLIADGRSDSGRRFSDLGPQARMDVMRLAYQGINAAFLEDIRDAVQSLPVDLVVSFAESEHATTMLTRATEIKDGLDEIDKSLSPVMQWFEHSRLYEP